MLLLLLLLDPSLLWLTHCEVEEEDATEEAEEVSGEQGQVDCRGARHLDHQGHEAVECVHTERIGHKEHGCGDTSTES